MTGKTKSTRGAKRTTEMRAVGIQDADKRQRVGPSKGGGRSTLYDVTPGTPSQVVEDIGRLPEGPMVLLLDPVTLDDGRLRFRDDLCFTGRELVEWLAPIVRSESICVVCVVIAAPDTHSLAGPVLALGVPCVFTFGSACDRVTPQQFVAAYASRLRQNGDDHVAALTEVTTRLSQRPGGPRMAGKWPEAEQDSEAGASADRDGATTSTSREAEPAASCVVEPGASCVVEPGASSPVAPTTDAPSPCASTVSSVSASLSAAHGAGGGPEPVVAGAVPTAASVARAGRACVTVVPVLRAEDGEEVVGAGAAGSGVNRNSFRIARSLSLDATLQALARNMFVNFGLRRFEGVQASRVVLRLSGGSSRVTSMDDIHDGASYTIDVEGDTEVDKERDGLGFT